MDINNIYLIANDPSVTEKKINNLPLSDSDTVVLFNDAESIKFAKIKHHPNKYLFLRANGRDNHVQYSGYENAIKNCSLYNKLFLINSRPKGIKILEQYFSNYEIIDSDNNIPPEYTSKKYPTSGFVALYYLKNIIDIDKIFLVNFYGLKNILSIHDYDYEQNYYKTHNIKII